MSKFSFMTKFPEGCDGYLPPGQEIIEMLAWPVKHGTGDYMRMIVRETNCATVSPTVEFVTYVPEPGAAIMLLAGAAMLALLNWRK